MKRGVTKYPSFKQVETYRGERRNGELEKLANLKILLPGLLIMIVELVGITFACRSPRCSLTSCR